MVGRYELNEKCSYFVLCLCFFVFWHVAKSKGRRRSFVFVCIVKWGRFSSPSVIDCVLFCCRSQLIYCIKMCVWSVTDWTKWLKGKLYERNELRKVGKWEKHCWRNCSYKYYIMFSTNESIFCGFWTKIHKPFKAKRLRLQVDKNELPPPAGQAQP